MADTAISVIIPFRNEWDRLVGTLASIVTGRTTQSEIEIVVIDDASEEDHPIHQGGGKPGVSLQWVRLDQRVGVPRARNHGADLARGDILFMTDAHVQFTPGWDALVLDYARVDRILAATIADVGSRFRGYGCSLVVPFMGTRWNIRPPIANRLVHIASAAGMVMPVALFRQIGGYDEGMILYGGAEPEFSIRAWLSGAEVISVPELEIRHRFKQKSETNAFLKGMRPFMIHNNIRFGLLYLSELESLQMIRHFAQIFPEHVQEAFALLQASDVWERREYLQRMLKHEFSWFVRRFDLKDQVGKNIL